MHASPAAVSRSRAIAAVAIGAAMVVLAGACGSGGGGTAAAGSSTTTGQDSSGAFVACMRRRGVELPADARAAPHTGDGAGETGEGAGEENAPRSPTSLPAGVDQAAYDAARRACQDQLPAEREDANDSAYRAYLSCLEDRGAPVPTTTGEERPSIDRSDPKVAAADQVCSPLLGEEAGGDHSTTTTATSTSTVAGGEVTP